MIEVKLEDGWLAKDMEAARLSIAQKEYSAQMHSLLKEWLNSKYYDEYLTNKTLELCNKIERYE